MNLVTAAAIKRPSTNLVSEERFLVSKETLKSGFLGIFNKAYSGDPRAMLAKLVLAPVISTDTIIMNEKKPKPTSQEERKERALINKQIKLWEEQRTKQGLSQYTTLKKVNGSDPHFVLSLPVLIAVSAADVAFQLRNLSPAPISNDELEFLSQHITFDIKTSEFKAQQVMSRANGLPQNAVMMLTECLIGVKYVSNNNRVVMFAEFKITQDQAQYLVSKDWLEIRPLDLYPLFTMWVDEEFVPKYYGKKSFPLSKIAATMPAHNDGDERVDSYGIAIDMGGRPLYIPHKCDNTDKYESLFNNAGAQSNGSFCLRDIGSEDKSPTLPANIPILVDWVNNKFTYSNSMGKPTILPMEHLRKCNASMAMRLLAERNIDDKLLGSMEMFAKTTSINVRAADYIQTMDLQHEMTDVERQFMETAKSQGSIEIEEYFSRAVMVKVKIDPNFVPRMMDLTMGTDPIFLPVARFVSALHTGMLNNLEALYVKYAVTTITEALGRITLIARYGRHIDEVRAEANSINKKALDQGIDSAWTPPAAPLLTKKFSSEDSGVLPHQAKIRNVLRDSPDFAILSVDAGGGKSLLSITDILYEIMHDRSAPYLIMCPSHLVANYVSEIVEFTDGKVNTIPVTSFNIHTTGYKRFGEILKSAPINTVLVVDYDVLKFRAVSATYGTASVDVFPVIEFIRQFKPGYVMCDESHFLKNAKSARTRAVLSLISDIPKKRLASGTLNPDSPSDFPGQIALLDPTIFGTRDQFNETYGEDVKGGRVLKWRTSGPNSIGRVMAKLKESVVWAQAKRKEWACALPEREDRFISTSLTPKQQEMYAAIFDDMVRQIKTKASEGKDKNAKRLLDSLVGKKANKGEEEDFGDLGEADEEDNNPADDSEDIGASLQPYLADIERFVTNPSFHPYARNGLVLPDGSRIPPLTGEDLKSPKILAIEHLLKNHFSNPANGKAIIFTNYTDSARAIFDSMSPELKASGMLYVASQKTEMVNAFKTNPNIKWMVGIRTSLEVGLNLQIANLLVRAEGVWNPGQQEQGDSRICRPYFGKGGDKRPKLYFDTVVADRTIDITKAARLRAKQVALAKFENTNDPRYESIEDIPIIPMTLDNIQTQNDFDSNLRAYAEAMTQLNNVVKTENAEYKAKIEAEGGFKFTQIEQGPTPPDAALLSRVPYAMGTELYAASDMGLIRIDNYLNIESAVDEDEDDSEEGEEDHSGAIDAQLKAVIGLRCHTELGDGVIYGGKGKNGVLKRVNVNLDDGTQVRFIHVTNGFIITRTETNGVDMRNMIAKAAGLNVTADITVPGTNQRAAKMTQKQLREEEKRKQIELDRKAKDEKDLFKTKISVGLELTLVNGYMRLSFVPGKDAKVAKIMQAQGFKTDPLYVYTRIKDYKHLINQATLWADAGFNFDSKQDNQTFELLVQELNTGALKSHRNYAQLTGNAGFKNFYRQTWKASSDKKMLQMFALVTDGGDKDPAALRKAQKTGAAPNYGVAYLCLPYGGGHPATNRAINSKFKAPATRWFKSDNSLSIFVSNLTGVRKVIEELKASGIQVNNIPEINDAARSVKKIVPKNDETIDLHVKEEKKAK